jgi:hypothetical protein
MKHMKKLRLPALLLAAALLLLPGCNIIKVNPERDGAQIVATVDSENITKKDVYDAAGYTVGQKIDSWNLDSFKSAKEQMLQTLIAQKVILLKAKEQGMYNFTADEQKTIDDYVSANSANLDDKTKALLLKSEQDSIAYDKIKKATTDTVKPTDKEVQDAYNSDVTSQQTSYDADPKQAVTDDNQGTTPVVYYPDGVIRVRQILIPLPTDIQSQISTDRNTNTADSIKAADTLRDAELAKIKAKADDALTQAKAANGDLAKLDKLIVDLGNGDPGMASKPEGYLVCKDTTTYVTEFTTAAMALTDIGKPSDLVATDYGYHIIWITLKPAKGALPFDQVKDKMTANVTTTKQETAWENAVTDWMTAYKDKIHTYLGRLNN